MGTEQIYVCVILEGNPSKDKFPIQGVRLRNNASRLVLQKPGSAWLVWATAPCRLDLTFSSRKKKCTKKTICLVAYLLAPNRLFFCVCSVAWPLCDNKARGDFVCVNQVILMLTMYIYMTKTGRSVSKQGHLQPRCHLRTRLLSRQL